MIPTPPLPSPLPPSLPLPPKVLTTPPASGRWDCSLSPASLLARAKCPSPFSPPSWTLNLKAWKCWSSTVRLKRFLSLLLCLLAILLNVILVGHLREMHGKWPVANLLFVDLHSLFPSSIPHFLSLPLLCCLLSSLFPQKLWGWSCCALG